MRTGAIEHSDEIDRLERSGDVIGALDAAIAANRAAPSLHLQRRLIALRNRAAAAYESEPRTPWPIELEDPFPEVGTNAIPEVPASKLTSELMGAAIAHHGSLIVRGFFDAPQVARTTESVNRTVDAAHGDDSQGGAGFYEPTLGLSDGTAALRASVVAGRSVWLGDSPRATAQVLDDLDRAGVTALIEQHFDERPVISLEKSTLRKIQPEVRYAAWHQDGSFLGQGARALNVWVALTSCGGARPAPGLQVVAGRVPKLLPLDGHRRASIDGMEVHLFAKEKGFAVIEPEFAPGDAILFDELMTHRTYFAEGMTEARLALECWFFAPSNPAEKYAFMLV